MDNQDKIQIVKDSFLNHLWNVQMIKGKYILFCLPSAIQSDWLTNKNDEFIIWNSEKEFSEYHSHIYDYKNALHIINNLYQEKICDDFKNKQEYRNITSTLRVLDISDELMYSYINFIVDNNIAIPNIIKHIDGKDYEVRFNTYMPCPTCGRLSNDYIYEIDTYCCKRCSKVY